MNNDIMKASMRILAQQIVEERAELFDNCIVERHEYSNNYKRRLKQVFLMDSIKRGLRKAAIIGKRTAIVFAIIMALMLTACMSIKPLRENIMNAIVTWYDEYFTFEYQSDETNNIMAGEKNITYIPDGFTLYSNMSANGYVDIMYMNNDGNILSFFTKPYSGKIDWYNNEGCSIEQININRKDFISMMLTPQHRYRS